MRHPANIPANAVVVTPFDVLAEREDGALSVHIATEAREEALRIMAEVALFWLGWIFEGGPDLRRAGMRLYALALEFVPDLQRAMGDEALAACFASGASAEALAAVDAVARAHPHLVNHERLTPFTLMMAGDLARHSVVEIARRQAGLDRWLRWLYEERGGLLGAVKRAYSQARACRPELLWCMSGEQIATLFGQERATESARTLRVTESTLLAVGCRVTQMPYQKSAGAKRVYAQSQLGNRNRLGGRKAA